MKKLFTFFAISAIVLGMASCGDGNEPEQGPFTLEIKEVTHYYVKFTITPDDEEADYYWTWIAKSRLEEVSIEEDIEGSIAVDKTVHRDYRFQKGVYSNTGDKFLLFPNRDYILCACQIDEDGKIISPISQKPFKTTIPEGYVDLGLPSKTLWNASHAFQAKDTYPYYESELEDYQSNLKTYFTLMPTKDDWMELITECEWKWINDPNKEETMPQKVYPSFKVTGKNGNYIYLPAASLGKGLYWMEHSSSDEHSALEFGSTLNSVKFTLEPDSKYMSFCWIIKDSKYYD